MSCPRRAEEVALAAQLELAQLALGDVEPAEDDVAALPSRRRAERSTRRSRARRLARSRTCPRTGRAGAGRARSRSARAARPAPRARRRRPRRLMPDRLRSVASAGAAGGGVEVDDPSLGVERAEQRRGRVDDRLEEGSCARRSAWQPLVLEPEPGGRRDRVDELGVVGQRRVVQQRGDAAAVALDVGAVRRRRRGSPCRPPRRSALARAASTRSRATDRAAPRRAPRAGACRVASSSRRSPVAARASRLRRMPARNAIGTIAKLARNRYSSGSAARR